MNEREKFITLLSNEHPRRADAIMLMQGDGHYRAPFAAQLFHMELAPRIVLVGGAVDRDYGSYPSAELRTILLDAGVPENSVVYEETALNTRQEAERAIALARENGWKSLLIVTSPHHQYRVFLTFLQVMRDAKVELVLSIAPAPLPWFETTPWGRRFDLLKGELERIAKYQEVGDVAPYADGIDYLQWKEKHP